MTISKIYTGNNSVNLEIYVETQFPATLYLKVTDSANHDIILMERVAPVDGQYTFLAPMPLTRRHVDVTILNHDDNGSENGFVCNGYSILPLEKRKQIIDFETYRLNEFMDFICRVCFNFPVLRLNDPDNDEDYYCSTAKHFFIKLLDQITDYETGQVIDTPARVCINTRLFEVSKQYFEKFSVPERIALLCHEYGHAYANEDPDSEIESDLKGFVIYKAWGFPSIEALQAWNYVFEQTDTPLNRQRMETFMAFV